MSKFDTKNLIYEVNRLNRENIDLQAKLKELEEKLKACESCLDNDSYIWCNKKGGKDGQ